MASNAPQGQGVDLGQLSVQQLSAVKKQLDEELEHLTTSHAKLRAAQAKFRDCVATIATGLRPANQGKPTLVPLTSSLYVPGHLADLDRAVVDVGTGFYVEKSAGKAKQFYEERAKELEANLKDLEAIVQGKHGNLRMVEDVLRQKVIMANEGGGAAAPAAAAA